MAKGRPKAKLDIGHSTWKRRACTRCGRTHPHPWPSHCAGRQRYQALMLEAECQVMSRLNSSGWHAAWLLTQAELLFWRLGRLPTNPLLSTGEEKPRRRLNRAQRAWQAMNLGIWSRIEARVRQAMKEDAWTPSGRAAGAPAAEKTTVSASPASR